MRVWSLELGVGRLEGWKDGRLEGWKDGRMEGWRGAIDLEKDWNGLEFGVRSKVSLM
jgi:hypothetical protein